MGQRLVITVRNHGKDLAKLYYHWSAYSRSALEETQKLLNYILQYGKVLGINEVHPIQCFSCGAPVIGDRCEHCGTACHGHSITEKEFQLVLIRYCEQSGGGITGEESEYEHISQLFPDQDFKTDGVSRNDGIIALSQRGMDSLQQWSEGDVIIDLDREMIHNSVLYSYDSVAEYNGQRIAWDDDTVPMEREDIPELTYDPEEIPFTLLDNVCMEFGGLAGYLCRKGDVVYELIA